MRPLVLPWLLPLLTASVPVGAAAVPGQPLPTSPQQRCWDVHIGQRVRLTPDMLQNLVCVEQPVLDRVAYLSLVVAESALPDAEVCVEVESFEAQTRHTHSYNQCGKASVVIPLDAPTIERIYYIKVVTPTTVDFVVQPVGAGPAPVAPPGAPSLPYAPPRPFDSVCARYDDNFLDRCRRDAIALGCNESVIGDEMTCLESHMGLSESCKVHAPTPSPARGRHPRPPPSRAQAGS